MKKIFLVSARKIELVVYDTPQVSRHVQKGGLISIKKVDMKTFRNVFDLGNDVDWKKAYRGEVDHYGVQRIQTR